MGTPTGAPTPLGRYVLTGIQAGAAPGTFPASASQALGGSTGGVPPPPSFPSLTATTQTNPAQGAAAGPISPDLATNVGRKQLLGD
jgi:hypothetical protein